jgi:hypothetical protein
VATADMREQRDTVMGPTMTSSHVSRRTWLGSFRTAVTKALGSRSCGRRRVGVGAKQAAPNRLRRCAGGAPFPSGLAANRHTVRALLQYIHEPGYTD